MKIFSDIGSFFASLTFIDIVFFFLVVILIILVVTLIYFIRINQDNEVNEETAEMKIVKDIKDNMNKEDSSVVINLSDYEKDQEDKAIISYDELLHKSNKYGINYENEELKDDLSIKKVDLENFSTKVEEPIKSDAIVISFAKEEAFLEALKRLQKELG